MQRGKFINLSLAERKEIVKNILESAGYKFEHPTLILDGHEDWFVILTPHRPPFQMIVHLDENKEFDFTSTIPALIGD